MIEAHWDDPDHSIIRMDFSTPWTEEEYTTAHWQVFEMAEGRSSRLDLINVVDLNHGPPPENMLPLIHRALKQLPRQFVMIVTVTFNSSMAATTTGTLNRTSLFTEIPFKLRTAEHVEAARALIAQDRTQTGNLPDDRDVDSLGVTTSF